ncbi:MAG: hypothetical protein OEV91_07970 [Desulfobulbaceae bacterium]|nr:hypothetical protein [Desulfobulbaceae bacterium]
MSGVSGAEIAAFGFMLVLGFIFIMVVLGVLVPFFVWRIHRNVAHTASMLEQLSPHIIGASAALARLAAKREIAAANGSEPEEAAAVGASPAE